jgi:anti-sigma regulatory factor (Ser/Thr protein kinase)
VVLVLGDATGHGIAPALSVTQMQAMLRLAFAMGADLATAFVHVNNRLADTLADDRFITAFVGMLDPDSHRVRFHSGGQGPILHYVAARDAFDRHGPTSFPLGAMPLASLAAPTELAMGPGDILLVLSDGFYEQFDPDGACFGEARVCEIVRGLRDATSAVLIDALVRGIDAFAAGAGQQDDMTAVVLRREAPAGARVEARFPRTFDAIPALVAFTGDAFARLAIDPALRTPVDLALEELFTNMVKYGAGSRADVTIAMAAIDGGVELKLVDRDVARFDPTQAPPVDVEAPIEARNPGGLGVHLIRRMADSVEYEYNTESRESRITLRYTRRGRAAADAAAGDGGPDVRD